MDRDGYISNGELYLVLKQMVGNNLKVGVGAGVGCGRALRHIPNPTRTAHHVQTHEQPLTRRRTSNYSRLSTRRLWRRTRMGEWIRRGQRRRFRVAAYPNALNADSQRRQAQL